MGGISYVERLQAVLRWRPEVDLRRYPITIDAEAERLVLRGEVEHIAAKRVVGHEARRMFGAPRVLDRLRVRPMEWRADDDIAGDFYELLQRDNALGDYRKVERRVPGSQGSGRNLIEFSVRSGVVSLAGTVGRLSHRHLVDVLAWWVPGTGAVDNGLRVDPCCPDSDAALGDALRMVLARAPWLDAVGVTMQVQDGIVTLAGRVFTLEEAESAVQDAWHLPGVCRVRNWLQIHPCGEG